MMVSSTRQTIMHTAMGHLGTIIRGIVAQEQVNYLRIFLKMVSFEGNADQNPTACVLSPDMRT